MARRQSARLGTSPVVDLLESGEQDGTFAPGAVEEQVLEENDEDSLGRQWERGAWELCSPHIQPIQLRYWGARATQWRSPRVSHPSCVTVAVAARSPRGHGACPLRVPSPAGTLASSRPTAGCAARDQTRPTADFGPIHALTTPLRRGRASARDVLRAGDRPELHRHLRCELCLGMAGS